MILKEMEEVYAKSEEYNSKGKMYAKRTIKILADINSLNTDFAVDAQNVELMEYLTSQTGNKMEYSMAVAGILAKAKADIEALG